MQAMAFSITRALVPSICLLSYSIEALPFWPIIGHPCWGFEEAAVFVLYAQTGWLCLIRPFLIYSSVPSTAKPIFLRDFIAA